MPTPPTGYVPPAPAPPPNPNYLPFKGGLAPADLLPEGGSAELGGGSDVGATAAEQPTDAAPPEAEKNGAVRSAEAFARDLEQLLRTDADRWVAYAHGERLRTADTQTELYRYCLNDLGLGHDEFIVRCVVPDGGDEVEATPR